MKYACLCWISASSLYNSQSTRQHPDDHSVSDATACTQLSIIPSMNHRREVAAVTGFYKCTQGTALHPCTSYSLLIAHSMPDHAAHCPRGQNKLIGQGFVHSTVRIYGTAFLIQLLLVTNLSLDSTPSRDVHMSFF